MTNYSLENSQFYDNSTIKSVIINDDVTSIGEWVFVGCTGLTSITIPDSVTSIGDGAFCGCEGLTSITIPDRVTSIGDYVFDCCVKLTSITIPDSVTSIGNYAFYGCTALKDIYYKGTKDVNGIKNLFANSNIAVTSSNGKVGTGDTVTLCRANGEVYRTVSVVIFGDVNGDGVYDGQDSMIVSCLANGMLTEEQVGEAEYMAADCNHDGVIDQLDVDILNEAGVLLSEVDQTKSREELLETSSAYVEYLNLIQQSPETEKTAEKTVENTPTDDKEPVQINWFQMFVSFLKMLLNFVYGLFTL